MLFTYKKIAVKMHIFRKKQKEEYTVNLHFRSPQTGSIRTAAVSVVWVANTNHFTLCHCVIMMPQKQLDLFTVDEVGWLAGWLVACPR